MSGWIRGAALRAGLSLLGVIWAESARADDGALAEALFREAQTLMAKEQYEQACSKFEESQRLDPSTGTLLNLAVCHEKVEKLASAWHEFNAAVAAARRDQRADRVAFAEQRIAAIEPRLSLLTIELPKENDADGLTMHWDNTLLGRPALGVAFPVDAGTHTLSVKAPRKVTWTKQLAIARGPSQKSVSIPRLLDVPLEKAQHPRKAADGHPEDRTERGSTQRLVAYVLSGAGLVGLGIGTGFGIAALVKFGESNDNGCDGNACNQEGAALRNSARSAGDISTVAFIAGGTLLASGVVVYFTAPRRGASHARRGASHAVPDDPARVLSAHQGWSARVTNRAGGGLLSMEAHW